MNNLGELIRSPLPDADRVAVCDFFQGPIPPRAGRPSLILAIHQPVISQNVGADDGILKETNFLVRLDRTPATVTQSLHDNPFSI